MKFKIWSEKKEINNRPLRIDNLLWSQKFKPWRTNFLFNKLNQLKKFMTWWTKSMIFTIKISEIMKTISKESRISKPRSKILKDKLITSNLNSKPWKQAQTQEFYNFQGNLTKPWWIWERQLTPWMKAEKDTRLIFRNIKNTEEPNNNKEQGFLKELANLKFYMKMKKNILNHWRTTLQATINSWNLKLSLWKKLCQYWRKNFLQNNNLTRKKWANFQVT